MSWTPSLLVNRKQLDASIAKLEKRFEEYCSAVSRMNSNIKNAQNSETTRLRSNAEELRVEVDDIEIRNKAQEMLAVINLEKKERANLEKAFKEEERYLFDYLREFSFSIQFPEDNKDKVKKIAGREYYYFGTPDLSRRASAFTQFCEENNIECILLDY